MRFFFQFPRSKIYFILVMNFLTSSFFIPKIDIFFVKKVGNLNEEVVKAFSFFHKIISLS